MKLSLLILILSVIHLSRGVASCPQGCNSCRNGRVQCPGAGLTSMPRPLPEDTITIDLTQNKITSLDDIQSLPDVQSFRMPMNQLPKIKGDEFANVPSLVSLDLSINMITKVYKHGLRGLQNLKTISLNGNKITDIGLIFVNTPMITSIRLGNNAIEAITEANFQSNTMIKHLDLSNNKITNIHGDAFKNLDMLRYLILSNNPIMTVTDLTFSSSMLSLADFSNCALTSVPRAMPSSLVDYRLGNNKIARVNVEDFQNITSLKMLTLNDNKISHVDHRSFGDLENLKELWLSRNELVYIPRGLPKGLQKLFMDKNVVVELEQMLFKAESELTVLNLEGNKVFKLHKDSLKDVNKLEKLTLQGNAITNIEAGTFTHVPHLQYLSLTNNPIQGLEAGAFANLDSLTELSLSYVEPEGGEQVNILSDNFFAAMPNLTNLDMMSSVRLTKAYLELIKGSEAKPLENLKKWNLQYNELMTLPVNLRNVLPNVKQLLLDGNLLACDNRLLWLHDWMKTDSVAFHQYEKPMCDSPQSVKGQEISTLSPQDFGEPVITNPVQVPETQPQEHNQQPEPSNQKPAASGQETAPVQSQPNTNTAPESTHYNVRGTVVKITPPKGSSSSTGRHTSTQMTKKEKRKLERERRKREKAEKKRQRQRRKKQNDEARRKKRRIKNGKNCHKEADGSMKCDKSKKRNKCKVLEDGTVKCRKRKGKKQQKVSTSS